VNFIYIFIIFMGFVSSPPEVNLGYIQLLAVIIAGSGKWIYFYRSLNTIGAHSFETFIFFFSPFSRADIKFSAFYASQKSNTFTVSRLSSPEFDAVE
jgi:hypothetical protein